MQISSPPVCNWEGFSCAREILEEQHPESKDAVLEVIKQRVSREGFLHDPSGDLDSWKEVAERNGEGLACRIVTHVHYSRWNRMRDAARLAEYWCPRRDPGQNPVRAIQEIYRRTCKTEFHENPDLALRRWKAEGRDAQREGRMCLLRTFPRDLALEVIEETLHPSLCVLL